MKPGRLSFSFGLLETPDDVDAKLGDALVAEASNFLLGGGRLTLSEWAALSADERRALVAAGVEIEKDRADVVAAAILRAQLSPASVVGPPPGAPPA